MITIHASGHLIRDPAERTSASGNHFATCLLGTGDDVLINVAVFDAELCGLLLKCRKGDGLSVAGKATVSVYTAKDGATKPSVSVTANRLLTAASEGLARTKPRRDREHEPYAGSYPPADRTFDDDPPF